jgi:hypothetical protein
MTWYTKLPVAYLEVYSANLKIGIMKFRLMISSRDTKKSSFTVFCKLSFIMDNMADNSKYSKKFSEKTTI